MVLSSLKNRSCCPSEFFFQWFYRSKGLADTEITKKQKNTLSLLIILCTESEWTLTIFDLSKVQSLGCPHRLIGFHTTIKSYNVAPPLGYLLTSLPTSNISLDFPYSSPVLLWTQRNTMNVVKEFQTWTWPCKSSSEIEKISVIACLTEELLKLCKLFCKGVMTKVWYNITLWCAQQ